MPTDDELAAAREEILRQCAIWGVSGRVTSFRVPRPAIVAAALKLQSEGILECAQDQDHHGLPRVVLHLTDAGMVEESRPSSGCQAPTSEQPSSRAARG
jgi:hypothetical protein